MGKDEEQLIGTVFKDPIVGTTEEVVDVKRGGSSIVLESETGRRSADSPESLVADIQSDDRRVLKSDQLPPDPRAVHEERSEFAQKQDEARDARITTDREKWASDPNSFDFPGVDTGPTFREENPEFDVDSFLDENFEL